MRNNKPKRYHRPKVCLKYGLGWARLAFFFFFLKTDQAAHGTRLASPHATEQRQGGGTHNHVPIAPYASGVFATKSGKTLRACCTAVPIGPVQAYASCMGVKRPVRPLCLPERFRDFFCVFSFRFSPYFGGVSRGSIGQTEWSHMPFHTHT